MEIVTLEPKAKRQGRAPAVLPELHFEASGVWQSFLQYHFHPEGNSIYLLGFITIVQTSACTNNNSYMWVYATPLEKSHFAFLVSKVARLS